MNTNSIKPAPARKPYSSIAYLPVFVYLSLALIYSHTTPLVSDDYWNMSTNLRLVFQVPFVDFIPWNNLLGHYIQLPAVLVNPDPVIAPLNVRIELALINSLMLAFAIRFFLQKQFSSQCVLLAGLTFVTCTSFIENSIPVRLDMLASWAGLFALITMYNRRPLLSGFLTFISFMISQKGIYHFVSLNAGLFVFLIFFAGRKKTFFDGLKYNLTFTLLTILYYLPIVINSRIRSDVGDFIQYKAAVLEKSSELQGLYEISINHIFVTNYLYAITALAGLGMIVWSLLQGKAGSHTFSYTILATYLCALMCCTLIHPHPYEYFFVLILPSIWLVSHFSIEKVYIGLQKKFFGHFEQITPVIAALGAMAIGVTIPRAIWLNHNNLAIGLIFLLVTAICAFAFWGISKAAGRFFPGSDYALLLICTIFVLCCAPYRIIGKKLTEGAAYNRELVDKLYVPTVKEYNEYRKHENRNH